MIKKFMVKDLNLECLQEELVAAGLPSKVGMLIAGFRKETRRLYVPFTEPEVIATSTGQPDVIGEPGELQFRYDSALDARQERTLNEALVAHDASVLSTMQKNQDQDVVDVAIIAENYRNWGSLNDTEKDENARLVARLLARNQDRGLDL